MKPVFVGLLLGVFAVIFAHGADQPVLPISKPAVSEQITALIEAQLAAFRAGQVEKAYGYGAQALQMQTPLPAFAKMVRQNYPEIWQNTRAEFGLVRDNGARAMLVVHVFAKDAEAAYDYVLFKEPVGWRIGGVLRHEPHPANRL